MFCTPRKFLQCYSTGSVGSTPSARASVPSVVMRGSISSRSILATIAVVALADNVMRAPRELIGWPNGFAEKAGGIKTGDAFALPTNRT